MTTVVSSWTWTPTCTPTKYWSARTWGVAASTHARKKASKHGNQRPHKEVRRIQELPPWGRRRGAGIESDNDSWGERKSGQGLLENAGAGGNWAQAHKQLPPAWIDMVEEVEEDVRDIQRKMRELSELHSRRLKTLFDDERSQEQERSIEALTGNITQLFRHAEGGLRRVTAAGEAGGGNSDATVRANIQRATARKLQSLSMAFRSSQKEYLRLVQQQKKGLTKDFDFLADEEQRAAREARAAAGGLDTAQIAMLEDTEVFVQERDQEIRNIVTSIEELSTIFKELAVLVIDQGTILDRIDFNMEQVVEHTKEGVAQLQRAEEHQKSAFPLKCIMILLVLIAMMVAILIWKHS